MLLSVISVLPVLLITTILYKKTKVIEEKFLLRFGGLVQYLRLTNFGTRLYYFEFLMRRLIYAVSIIFLVGVPAIQILLQMSMSSTHLMYVLQTKPLDSPFENFLELVNEATILVIMTSLLIFTDDKIESKTSMTIGYVLITIILVNILINIVIALYTNVSFLCKRVVKPKLEKYRRERKAK